MIEAASGIKRCGAARPSAPTSSQERLLARAFPASAGRSPIRWERTNHGDHHRRMVKDLREKTGAGMMDCKAALNEDERRHRSRRRLAAQEGPLQGRQEVRPRRGRGPGRRRSRRPRRRLSRSTPRPTSSPATRSSRRSSATVANVALDERGPVRGALRQRTIPGSQTTVKDTLQELIATIGENMTLRRATKLDGRARRDRPLRPQRGQPRASARSACIVALESTGDVDELGALGRQIAMHVAATNPLALDASGARPGDGRAREGHPARQERRQARPCAREDRRERPQDLLQGGHACSIRPSCTSPRKTVAQALKEAEGEGRRAGQDRRLRPLRARRRHREAGDDFAAEVAAAAGRRRP